MEELSIILGRASDWLKVLFGADGMPTMEQEYSRAAAIFLTIALMAGIATYVLKRGSLSDTLVWLISGCIFGMAITGEAPFWMTVAFTIVLLASYWLFRYFGMRSDKPANRRQ
jgi:hypothetical protein